MIGFSLDELPTPAILVDLDVLERNVQRMAARAKAAGVRLRPHAKTHKSVVIGAMQRAAGAAGLSLAKTSEAEVFVTAGFDDLFLAFPVVGADKGRRLLDLSERARIAVGVDSVEGGQTLAGIFHQAGRKLDVLIKVDVGLHRVGVAPEHALDLARAITDVPGLRLRGIFTHAGHGYLAESQDGVQKVAQDEGETLGRVAAELRAAGIPVEEVSVGSTPTAARAMTVPGVTECRPGNYVFHDASQVGLGTCAIEDCALTILATVVSVPARDRAVVDAGSKTLSNDPLRPRAGGHGWVLGKKSRLKSLSEEHGAIDVVTGDAFRVGERVRILPNHACVVANLHDRLLGVQGDRVEAVIDVTARGRIE
ncbi:MAG: alanine racemase [Solirubrobacterales bacterium]|jgi:D-serine deaminase-like pyridoxal phosphate-dependent protein